LDKQQLMPEDRLQETLSDLLGISISTATLNRFSRHMYETLAPFESALLARIKVAHTKHLDETGFRIGGKTQWLHVASTKQLTYYHCSAKRKSLLSGLEGIVIHDHWKSYYQLPDVLHGLCNQHHLRELRALIEHEKEQWARNMRRCLRVALRYRHQYPDQAIPEKVLERLNKLYDCIVSRGIKYHESLPGLPQKGRRGRWKRRTGHNLLLRLKYYKEDVLRFLVDPEVPFTNNQAEQDIRMMKCKQKISGGFRSDEGARIFARLRGFISTSRKQGWNVFDSIQQAIRGSPPAIA
jgi:transposase